MMVYIILNMVLSLEKNMEVTKKFAKYVSQNIFGMLGVSCYIIVDTYFIAKAAGADGITVLNLALPIYSLIFALGAMIGIGSATRFAISRAQKSAESEYYFANAVLWAMMLGLLFVVAGVCFPDKILQLMGGDSEIVALGVGYVRIFLLFGPFFMMNYVFSAFVRNDNGPTLAMIGTMAGSLSNVLLDYIFMFPMKMGLPGAALATAASPIISILICSIHFLNKKNTIRFRFRCPSFRRLIRSCQLGISAFIGEISSGVTTAVFNFLILNIAGNIGVAAYGVVANFSIVAVAIFNGIAQGAQPLVSDYYGRKDTQALKKTLRLGLGTAMIIALLIYGTVFLFTDPFVALFNSENSAVLADYAFSGMRIYFIGFLFAGINIVGAAYLSAVENPRGAFVISITRGVIAIVGCSLLLAWMFAFTGVWMSFAVAEGMTVVLTILFLAGKGIGKQKKNSLTT